MIARFRPYYKLKDLISIFYSPKSCVKKFENKFKTKFEMNYAFSFSYGRTALYVILKSINAKNLEVIIPSYTCSVVGNAVVLSGAIPKFVDSSNYNFNMIIDEIENKISKKTRAIVVTHIFGYPMDVKKIQELVTRKEKEYNNKIFVIQDCAHSFGAFYKGNKTWQYGDCAFFGLNISKTINSVYGGIILTNNDELAKKIIETKKSLTQNPSLNKEVKRRLFFICSFFSFNPLVYKFINYLENNTPFLDRLTKEYHLDDNIHFPLDYKENLTNFEAHIGLNQLDYYDEIINHKRKIASYYNKFLINCPLIKLPPIIEGSTYSHYVVIVKNKKNTINELRKINIQLGELIQYSLPELNSFKNYGLDQDYINSKKFSISTINLPLHMYVNKKKAKFISENILNLSTNKL